MAIQIELLWPTIIPYELWIDMMIHAEFYVSRTEAGRPEWRGWQRVKERDLDKGRGEQPSVLTIFAATKFFPLASWQPCHIDEPVPLEEQTPLGTNNPYRLVRRSSLLLLNNFSQFLLRFNFQLELEEPDRIAADERSAYAADALRVRCGRAPAD